MADELADSLREAFDQRACTGFTIWLTQDGKLQANLRRADGISWSCEADCRTVEDVIKHIDSFNDTERVRGTNRRRIVVEKQKALPAPKPVKKKADDLL